MVVMIKRAAVYMYTVLIVGITVPVVVVLIAAVGVTAAVVTVVVWKHKTAGKVKVLQSPSK